MWHRLARWVVPDDALTWGQLSDSQLQLTVYSEGAGRCYSAEAWLYGERWPFP